VHAILDRNGLVKKRGRKRFKATGTNLNPSRSPNDLWCVDYKGQFRLGNRKYCYPLTMSDHYSRYLLCCEALESTSEKEAIPMFKETFKKFGLRKAIRSDNGVPFCTTGNLGLSKLSVLWLKLGIKIERIRPGNPQENGRHERMHRTLKESTTRPAKLNFMQQQESFDKFIEEYNLERPHEALDMKFPAEFYNPSPRRYNEDMLSLEYPFHDKSYRVALNGQINPRKGHFISIGKVFTEEEVGITEVDDNLWQIDFKDYTLGYYDFDDKSFSKMNIFEESDKISENV
jgi:putative transposase